jgi:hypothetical protein
LCGGINQLILSADMAIVGESSPPLLLSNVPSDPMPAPSLNDLTQLPNGWAVCVITKVISRLHSAAGTPTPAWLVPV